MAKILVIDDEEGTRDSFKIFLSDEGYEVTTAEDYDKAIASIEKEDFDLVFSDIVLKGKSGLDFFEEAKQKGLNCPVVMITGYPDIQTAARAIRLGAFDYIPKPVEQDALLEISNRALKYKTVLDEKEKFRSNLEAIFRSVKDGIITVDEELKLLEMNEAAERIFGLSKDKAFGRPLHSLPSFCVCGCLETAIETVKSKQPLEKFRLKSFQGKGSLKFLNLSTYPLLTSRNEVAGCVMIVKDITRLVELEQGFGESYKFHNILGKNRKMQEVYSLIGDLSNVDATVLITGESGTGKELVAEALHYGGKRNKNPLIKVNCSALPEGLIESELFGHVKGAFTGAIQDKTGRFQKANGGTIFLDEIGDISPGTQVRLLRVLQEKEIERVGESTVIKVDVRVITATNQDLKKNIDLGRLREDLYYRLNVVELELPPLRDRSDDIPLFVKHFLGKFNKKNNKNIKEVSDNVMQIFLHYPWPGNIRELENVIEHAVITTHQSVITVDDLPERVKENYETDARFSEKKKYNECEAIIKALEKCRWNQSKAARLLGIHRKTLYNKIKKYTISKS
tara:strand:+ start:1496 stop:3193 length:1698 start_codon:yes stop_codon:yes gene_type:complete